MYNIKVHKDVIKFITKQQTAISSAYNKWIIELKSNPHKANDGKLKYVFSGCKKCPVYKKRFGDFRVIYIVNDTELLIFVIDAGSRGQIYNKYK